MRNNIQYIEPPRGHEIELRTLCALMQLGDHANIRVQQTMLKLTPECFADINHRMIFELIHELFTKGKPFDWIEMLTLTKSDLHLVIKGVLDDQYGSTVNLEEDVNRLLDYKQLRMQLKILVDTVNLSLEHSLPQEALGVISDQLQSLAKAQNNSTSSIVRSYFDIADEFLSEECEDNSEFTIDIPDLPPVMNKSLITIAGRSGHGKTFFALYLMDKIIDAQPNKQTLYFNLEMHERVMMERHARILGFNGDSRRQVINAAASTLIAKNVSLISEPMITIEQIETESRLASLRQPIAVIVVDYLGLVSSKARYERENLKQCDISKRLAALADNLNCVVICLIQVNREFKLRKIGSRCPLVEDSGESMGSVHSASWWIGIDRPELDDKLDEYRHLFQVRCRKSRGMSGNFELDLKFCNGMFSKWVKPFSCKRQSIPDGF